MTKLPFQAIKRTLFFTWTLINFTSTQLWAQTAQPTANQNRGRVLFSPPKEQEPSGEDRGTPGNREGAGKRPSGSNCKEVDKPLTALVPATKSKSVLDLTISESVL